MANISEETLTGMIEHMNEHHAEAVVAYARHFGGVANVNSATIVELDALGFTVNATSGETHASLRIPFDHELVDAMDGRKTLVEMFEKAT